MRQLFLEKEKEKKGIKIGKKIKNLVLEYNFLETTAKLLKNRFDTLKIKGKYIFYIETNIILKIKENEAKNINLYMKIKKVIPLGKNFFIICQKISKVDLQVNTNTQL